MAALILTRADVARLLDLDACIAAVEDAFRQHALGAAVPPAVLSAHGENGAFHIKTAGVDAPAPYFAAKINGNFPGNRQRCGLPTVQGVIVLADLQNGQPLAVMDSIEITIQRTGAATAVAAKYLALDGPAVVTIAGCGVQGRIQLRSVAAVRPIHEVHAYDTDAHAARQFALEMTPLVDAPIYPTADLPRALAASTIVVTCTTSRRPIVLPGHVRPGAFVAAVGADNPEKSEIDPRLLASARVVTDVTEQAATLGDLHHAISARVMTRDDVHAELGEIVTGRKPGRTSANHVFVFDSTGMALQDVTVAALVYQRGCSTNIGTPIAINDQATPKPRLTPVLELLSRLRHHL